MPGLGGCFCHRQAKFMTMGLQVYSTLKSLKWTGQHLKSKDKSNIVRSCLIWSHCESQPSVWLDCKVQCPEWLFHAWSGEQTASRNRETLFQKKGEMSQWNYASQVSFYTTQVRNKNSAPDSKSKNTEKCQKTACVFLKEKGLGVEWVSAQWNRGWSAAPGPRLSNQQLHNVLVRLIDELSSEEK